MSTMYSRSVAMLSQAKNALLSVQEDDAFLDVTCFLYWKIFHLNLKSKMR